MVRTSIAKPALRAGFALMLALPFLTGCGEDTKRELGWEKTPPDEFEVTTRAPLSQPPDYDLRPPAPGAARPQEAATDRAKKVLISSVGGSTANDKASSGNSALDGLSAGEGALIKKAGAENATSAIRKQVDEETTALVEEGNSFTDDILFWQKKPEPGEIIDPVKEQQRLEVNASLGKSATDGDSPQITRRQRGWLEGIF